MNVYISRFDYGNSGDLWSSPVHYVSKPARGLMVDCMNLGENAMPTQDVNCVVVGGGALLCSNKFIGRIRSYISNLRYRHLVVWGVGSDFELDTGFFHDSAMFSTREETQDRHRWIPCASVMHPAMAWTREHSSPTKDFLVIDHWKRHPILLECHHTRIVNNPVTIEEMLKLIGDHRWVITSSYHAAYWATLLDKKVIVCSDPWQPKFDNFRHPPVLATRFKWELLDRAVSYPNAYDECLQANHKFLEEFESIAIPAHDPDSQS